jgi:hypothetical protein
MTNTHSNNPIKIPESEPLVDDESPNQDDAADEAMVWKGNLKVHQQTISRSGCCLKSFFALFVFIIGILIGSRSELTINLATTTFALDNSSSTETTVSPSSIPHMDVLTYPTGATIEATTFVTPELSSYMSKEKIEVTTMPPSFGPHVDFPTAKTSVQTEATSTSAPKPPTAPSPTNLLGTTTTPSTPPPTLPSSKVMSSPTIPETYLNVSSEIDVPGAVYGYNDVDWGDCIFKGPACNNSSNYSPIVMKNHRLIFFHCPKNGSTEWLKLFRRMMGYDDWKTFSPHDPFHNGLSRLDQYPRRAQLTMMTSPIWTRATFVRDPLERVLSAYLNKALSSERYLKKKCCQIYPRGSDEQRQIELQLVQQKNPKCIQLAPFEQRPTLDNFAFETFVNDFMEQCNDIHWRPQNQRIRYKNWKFLNFIGHFETLHNDTVRLLTQVKASQYAQSGWGENGDLALFEQERSKTEGPVTHSHDRLQEFYTPELRRKVLKYVKQDYTNKWMNLTKPVGFLQAIHED